MKLLSSLKVSLFDNTIRTVLELHSIRTIQVIGEEK